MFHQLTKLEQLSNLIDRTTEATKTAIRTCNPTPSIEETHLPSIDEFVLYVILRSYATVPELIMCLIYLSRFQERLPPCSFLMRPSTPHRVFLAALMMAHKVYNDSSVNNTCWAECSAFPECGFAGFSNVEVNLIEREFLSFLDWEVHISPGLYDAVSRVVHTPSHPPYPLQTELPWACECCVCINGYANSAQGL